MPKTHPTAIKTAVKHPLFLPVSMFLHPFFAPAYTESGGVFMGECLTPENILFLAAAASARLAHGATAEDLGLLAAFFTVIGDNLALLALFAPSCEDKDRSASDK